MRLACWWLLAGCGAEFARQSEPAMAPPPPPAPAAENPPAGSGARREVGAAKAAMAGQELDGATVLTEEAPKDDEPGGDRPAARAWFPESFLWMPIVETGPTGSTTVPVTVPDTLTTWRVLGLGWSATGAVGGGEGSFRSTLPAYVDLVLPRALYAGDQLAVPVQVVNQAGEALGAPLEVRVRGQAVGGGEVAVDPWGSTTRFVRLDARTPGSWTVAATLGELDAVEKTVEVRPSGRPARIERGGTLAAPRELELAGVGGATPGDLVVTVFPGALGVVVEELALAADRGGGVDEAAYLYALSVRGQALVHGGEADADDLRDLGLRALQRLSRPLRAPDALTACEALPGVRGAEPDTPAGRLAERLAHTVRRGQQPDGLWTMPGGTPQGRGLVAAARCTWALGPDAPLPRLRAASAFARFEAQLAHPVIAAWALAAGLVEGEAADAARGRVRDALETAPDGSRRLPGDPALRVGTPEATALAALALADTPEAADLAAGLLARWSPAWGFGDGTAGLVALDALARVMGGEVPGTVKLRLTVDGQPAGESALDASHPHRPVTLRAPGLDGFGPHRVGLVAEPAVPGLAFTLVSTSWSPWNQPAPAGLDLRVEVPGALRVGQRAELRVTATGPRREVVDLALGLPAGVEVDRALLQSRRPELRFRAEDGVLHLEGVTLDDGRFGLEVPVVPNFAGRLSSGPCSIHAADGGDPFVRVPVAWDIAGG